MSWLSRLCRPYFKRRSARSASPPALSRWQEAFCDWNAQRLGISTAESHDRFFRSMAALPDGHNGRAFKRHAHAQMELCRPFWGSEPTEIHEAYVAHEPLQFLRLLSYQEPSLAAWPELLSLEKRPDPEIVDFGCGLAHFSIACAEHLRKRGVQARLFLADLPLLHVEFLRWLCPRWELRATFAVCTPECPIPELPACDLCVATEVLEHVHEPMKYLEAFSTALKPGGFLLTNISDHEPAFVHVSADLSSLRKFLAERGWRVLRANRLYQKPGGT